MIEPVGLTRRVWRRSRSIERLSFQGLVLKPMKTTELNVVNNSLREYDDFSQLQDYVE